jgi:hypothetical protein
MQTFLETSFFLLYLGTQMMFLLGIERWWIHCWNLWFCPDVHGLWWGYLVISLEWFQNFKGSQVLSRKLWLPYSDEVGCGEFITTHEQWRHISQSSISIHQAFFVFLFFSILVKTCFLFCRLSSAMQLSLLGSPMKAFRAMGDLSSPHYPMSLWTTLLMFEMRTCCIIKQINYVYIQH